MPRPRGKGSMRHAIIGGMHARAREPAVSPLALIEARKANAAAIKERAIGNPCAYAFGVPLPGRSALDKMKREGREIPE